MTHAQDHLSGEKGKRRVSLGKKIKSYMRPGRLRWTQRAPDQRSSVAEPGGRVREGERESEAATLLLLL